MILRLIMMIAVLQTSTHANYILNPLTKVFYSQKSDKGVLLTNSKDINVEISNVYKGLVAKSTSEASKLLLDSYRLDMLTKMTKTSDKLPKLVVATLETNYKAMLAYIDKGNMNSEFLIIAADLGALILPNKSLATLIKIAQHNQKLYLKALEQDKTYFGPYLRLSTWYYFAPKIGGGDLNVALDYLNKGEAHIKNEYDRFQFYVWRSQIYFRLKQKDKSQSDLEMAKKIYPHSTWIQDIIELNKKGKFYK